MTASIVVRAHAKCPTYVVFVMVGADQYSRRYFAIFFLYFNNHYFLHIQHRNYFICMKRGCVYIIVTGNDRTTRLQQDCFSRNASYPTGDYCTGRFARGGLRNSQVICDVIAGTWGKKF